MTQKLTISLLLESKKGKHYSRGRDTYWFCLYLNNFFGQKCIITFVTTLTLRPF